MLYLEYLGMLAGLICVYLATQQNIWNFVFTIISSLSFAIVFFNSQLYGFASLQLYFIAISIYGWMYWSPTQEGNRKITQLPYTTFYTLVLGVALVGMALGYSIHQYTHTSIAYLDGFCTAISIVAQFLLSRKVLQNWILWLITDSVSIPIYTYKKLYPTAFLYLIFLYLALQGYRQWKRQIN